MNVEKIDVKGKMCPIPVALTKRKLAEMQSGQTLEITGEGELEFDNIQHWLKNNAHEIIETSKNNNNEFKIAVTKH
ncbi:MAG: sulfurtransferase TusA family protein [Nitrososphaerota archaeon]|nr:sulfurtransferase TusA family protein [Nitrososphaerota archaeon]